MLETKRTVTLYYNIIEGELTFHAVLPAPVKQTADAAFQAGEYEDSTTSPSGNLYY